MKPPMNGADDADDEVGEKPVVAAGDPFGKPAGDQAHDDPCENAHDVLSALVIPCLSNVS